MSAGLQVESGRGLKIDPSASDCPRKGLFTLCPLGGVLGVAAGHVRETSRGTSLKFLTSSLLPVIVSVSSHRLRCPLMSTGGTAASSSARSAAFGFICYSCLWDFGW